MRFTFCNCPQRAGHKQRRADESLKNLECQHALLVATDASLYNKSNH